jgi:hypothetical protein
MRQVVRYICDVCSREHPTPEMAMHCEGQDRDYKLKREVAVALEKKWTDEGHDVWHEHGGIRHAPRVDPKKFGSHDYGKDHKTSDCGHKCGCWMGPAASGGPVNPFGACPKNQK